VLAGLTHPAPGAGTLAPIIVTEVCSASFFQQGEAANMLVWVIPLQLVPSLSLV